MKLRNFFEFVQNDFEPIKSFRLKNELNPKIWNGFNIDQDIREQLLTIAQDFYNSTDLDAKIKDIILTGSLANYNWSNKYSDFDLHIVIDYVEVNEDIELVEKLTDYAKKVWMNNHDIDIKGYEVEVYIQNSDSKLFSSGVFSLLNNKWDKKPIKEEFEPDEEAIRSKAKPVMQSIDDIEKEFNNLSYDEFEESIKVIWDKIKKFRKSGLETEGGELSVGNLVFKLLRRNGYIEKVINLKRKAYDKQFK